MEIHEIKDADVVVLAPDAAISDSEETSALEVKLGTTLKTGGRLLVFDCAAAGQLTSSALRVLLLTSRKLDRTEGRLVLCGMNARLAKAFAISGFDKDVIVVATRDEALRRVREPILPRPPRKEPSRKASRKAAAPPPAPAADPEPIVEPVEAIAAVAPEVPVAPIAPIEPALPAASARSANVSDAIVDVLIDKLGVRVPRSAAVWSSGVAPSNLDALANGLLAALRAGRP
jgi:anti-anti-sigma factor